MGWTYQLFWINWRFNMKHHPLDKEGWQMKYHKLLRLMWSLLYVVVTLDEKYFDPSLFAISMDGRWIWKEFDKKSCQ